jgi:hypothetical protein
MMRFDCCCPRNIPGPGVYQESATHTMLDRIRSLAPSESMYLLFIVRVDLSRSVAPGRAAVPRPKCAAHSASNAGPTWHAGPGTRSSQFELVGAHSLEGDQMFRNLHRRRSALLSRFLVELGQPSQLACVTCLRLTSPRSLPRRSIALPSIP